MKNWFIFLCGHVHRAQWRLLGDWKYWILHPFQLLEYQLWWWGDTVFDTLGKWECAHRAGGPTPYKGWVPSFAVGGRGKGGRRSFPLSPTTKEGPPLIRGGFPLLRWVRGGGRSPLPPTSYKGWALQHGGHTPISLEYQIQPPPHHHS